MYLVTDIAKNRIGIIGIRPTSTLLPLEIMKVMNEVTWSKQQHEERSNALSALRLPLILCRHHQSLMQICKEIPGVDHSQRTTEAFDFQNTAAKLKYALQLTKDNEEFEILRNDFRLLGKRFLEADEQTSSQKRALNLMRQELKDSERYKSLLKDADQTAPALIIQLICEQHDREWERRLGTIVVTPQRPSTPRNAPVASSPTSATGLSPPNSLHSNRHEERQRTARRSRALSEDRIRPYPMYLLKSRRTLLSCSSSSASASSASSSNSTALYPCPSSWSAEDFPMGPISPTSSYTPRPPDAASDLENNRIVDRKFIQNFLRNCIPDMTHFTEAFVEFGCTTDEHVRAMSLNWDKSQRIKFFDRLPKARVEGKFYELDTIILEHHIEKYFK
ncbi:hypothetical protein CPC08DRAFT_762513 [Agrocybe pediades]|nr:hypothetical protein CPC08DRAFT_762513 [Agrocybe pediades]